MRVLPPAAVVFLVWATWSSRTCESGDANKGGKAGKGRKKGRGGSIEDGSRTCPSTLPGQRKCQVPHPHSPHPSSAEAMVGSWSNVFSPAMLSLLEAEAPHITSVGRGINFKPLRTKARFAAEAATDALTKLLYGSINNAEKAGVVGVKFWLNLRDDVQQNNVFHMDKDEGLTDKTGATVAPLFTSVFFLSDGGPPTVVLNQTFDRTGMIKTPDFPTSGFFSFPRRNRVIFIRGDLVHGVDGSLTTSIPHEPRVTFICSWEERVPLERVAKRREVTDALAALADESRATWSDQSSHLVAEHKSPAPPARVIHVDRQPREGDSVQDILVIHDLGAPTRSPERTIPWMQGALRIVLPLQAILKAASEGATLHLSWSGAATPTEHRAKLTLMGQAAKLKLVPWKHSDDVVQVQLPLSVQTEG